MSGRRTLAAVALALMAAFGAAGARAADGRPAVTLRVTAEARALEPGEPVRFVATATAPVDAPRGRFLEQELAFLPADAEGRAWVAWGAIPLDRKAGAVTAAFTAAVRGAGADPGGAAAAFTLTLKVRAKTFPEERLTVPNEYVTPKPEVEARIAAEQKLTKEIYARRTPRPVATAPFTKPVPGDASAIFGSRRFFNGQPRATHPGVDLRAATGTPVAAAGPGVVALARELYFSGNVVVLDHGGGVFTIYAHLSRIDVTEGDDVAQGAPLGLSGATGRVTGPHLHWGLRIGDQVVDPRALLDARLFSPGPAGAR